jgi:membrane-associated protein
LSSVWEFLKELTNPESIIHYGGLALLLFIVFAETGLLIGFFLPGDSLLFIAGLLCATNYELMNVDIQTLILELTAAAIIGNIVGYLFGRKVGERLFRKEDSLIFKKKYIEVTRSFYARHGGKALILGRFLPIIRTFVPILAGVIQVDMKRFLLYNVIGAVLWVSSLTFTGYYLGQRFPFVKQYLGWIVIGLIIITLIPVIQTYVKEKKHYKKGEN